MGFDKHPVSRRFISGNAIRRKPDAGFLGFDLFYKSNDHHAAPSKNNN
jgi:hypothetical protein